MPEPATSSVHAHVPRCECEQCLNSQDASPYIAPIEALCDECRPHTAAIITKHSGGLRLRCGACDAIGVQGVGIEALAC